MPSLRLTGLTGEGRSYVSGGATVTVLQVDVSNIVVTSPRIRVLYTTDPRFLQYAGQIVLGDDNARPAEVLAAFPIHWAPHQQWNIAGVAAVATVFWKLPPGLTLDLELAFT